MRSFDSCVSEYQNYVTIGYITNTEFNSKEVRCSFYFYWGLKLNKLPGDLVELLSYNPGQKSLGHPEKIRAKLDICEKCIA